jgi:predicted ATPase/class 3 adenylate cyclase
VSPGEYAFLFTDLAGSSRLWEQHPDAMGAALADHDTLLRQAIEAAGGVVFSTMGDGLAAVFDSADTCLAAAAAAQRALAAHQWGVTGPLRVRMAAHVGPAERRDSDYFGPTLNRCARVMAVGHGGQVLLSAAAKEALANSCELLDLGVHRLRDLAAPEHVFQALYPDLPSEFPALRSLESRPGNLPLQTTTFVGRADDVVAALAAMDQARVITLTGVGGAGKTRLALQIAAEALPRFPEGAWLCELAPVGDPAAVAHAVAGALGVIPTAGETAVAAMVAALQDRRMLVILDNCEHVLDAASALVEDLVRACAGVTILATSREALAVEGEVTRSVRALGTAGAVQLFLDRATAARPDFVLTPDAEVAIGEICRRLDGVPLAIELAAARVTSMSPAEIAARLGERFRLLTGGRRTAVERQRTLRGTVDWSFGLLAPSEQRVFARLSVFAGGFTQAAADAVCADIADDDVFDVLESVVRKSMVTVEDSGGGTRYSLLETLRQYGEEQLDAFGDADAARARHAAYFAALAEEGFEGTHGADEARWVGVLNAEVDNLRVAVAWAVDEGDAETVARIVAALDLYAFLHMWSEFADWTFAALDLIAGTSGRLAALVYAAAVSQSWQRGEVDRVHQLADDGLAAAGDDDEAQARIHIALGNGLGLAGDLEGALRHRTTGLEAFRRAADPWATSMGLSNLVLGLVPTGQMEFALELNREAMEIARRIDNPTAIGYAAYSKGELLLESDPDESLRALEEANAVLTPIDSRFLLGVTRVSLVSAAGRTSDPQLAVAGYLDLLAHWSASGNRPVLWVTMRNAAELLSRAGDDATFATVYGALRKADRLPPEDSPEHARLAAALERTTAGLGPDEAEELMAVGERMDADEVLAVVRDGLGRLSPA